MADLVSCYAVGRRLLVFVAVLVLTFGLPASAWAHPLGNFTINQYAGIHISRDGILIEYILDMAEIPSFQEIVSIDANGNGRPDIPESALFHSGKCASLRPDLELGFGGKPVPLTLASSTVEFPPGAGGLLTLRLTCIFKAELASVQENAHVTFKNNAYNERLGWNEIVVRADGVSLQGDFPVTSPSDRLTNYPQDLLSSPLDQRQIEFDITAITAPGDGLSPAASGNVPLSGTARQDVFTRLVQLEELNLYTVLIALAISFVWGAMHAMTPGHGKTIVGAYLVGSRGTPKHALYLGLTTTIAHTLGVFALGLVTLFAAQFIVPDQLYPWMSFLSGLLVIGIGTNLLIDRYKSAGLENPLQNLKAQFSRSSPTVLPSQSAIQSVHHDSQVHSYILQSSHSHPHPHTYDHSHVHGHHHDHDHGDHSHLPPGVDGASVTWQSLLLLGISGGIIPCPSALVVLLGAIAMNRIGFGLVLVLAFSIGLAGALTATGLVFMYAGRFFERVPARGRVIRLLPVLSAFFITLIGLIITLRALQEVGILTII